MGNSAKKTSTKLTETDIERLKATTNMTEEEILEWHQNFIVTYSFL